MTEPSRIRLTPGDPTPAFEQIRRQIVAHISSGALPVGSRLPALRQLARDLGIAVNTAAHAYRLLDDAGLITTRSGGGTRVARVPESGVGEAESAELRSAASAFFDTAADLGADRQQAVDAVLAEARRRSGS